MNDYDQLQQLRNQQLSRTIQYTGELARMERVSIEQAETIIRLKAALKPFADAAEQIPDSLKSCLWFWNGGSYDGAKGVQYTMLLGATTEDLQAAREVLSSTAEPDTLTPEQIEMNKQRRGQRMTAIQADVKANAAAQPRGYPKRVRMLQSHIWGNMPNGKSFKVSVGDQLITAPPPFSVDPDKTTDVWIDIHGERRMLPAGTWERVEVE